MYFELQRQIEESIRNKNILLDDVAKARLVKELDCIISGGLQEHFMINCKIAAICDRLKILRAPAKDATASWFVNYCLGICGQNPITENYHYEQFLYYSSKYFNSSVNFEPFRFEVPLEYSQLIMNELEKELGDEYSFYIIAKPPNQDNIESDIVEYNGLKYYYDYEDMAVIERVILHRQEECYFITERIDGKNFVFFNEPESDYKRHSPYIYTIWENMELGFIDDVVKKLPEKQHPYLIEMDNQDVFSFIASGKNPFMMYPCRIFVPDHIQIFNPKSIQELMVFIEQNFSDIPSPSHFHHNKEYSAFCSKLNYTNLFKKDKHVSEILAISYDEIITLDQVYRLAVEVGGMKPNDFFELLSKIPSKEDFRIEVVIEELSNNIAREILENSSLDSTEIEKLRKKIEIRLYYTRYPHMHLSGLYHAAVISYWLAYYYYLFPQIAKEPFDEYYKTLEKLTNEHVIDDSFYEMRDSVNKSNERKYEITFLEFVEALKKDEDYDGDIAEKIRKELR